MKHDFTITVLLIVGALFQSPTTAEASHERLNSGLQGWLAPIAHMEEKRPAQAGNHPLLPMARFYQKVGFQPVWTSPHGLLPQGEVLLHTMANASEAGLFSQDDRISYLETIRTDEVSFSDGMPLPRLEPYIQQDVILTNRVLHYAQHLSQGRIIPEALFQKWLAWRRPSTRDIPAELAEALNEDRLMAYMESLHPTGQAYRGLRKALRQYEQIKHSGGWPTIEAGPTLRTGDQGPRVEALKQRLNMTDGLSTGMPVDHTGYDESVADAVRRFQRRHGLRADGLVGKRTLAELNISVEERITQLQLNMERWRWFPDSFGDRYLMVNIPAYELSVVEANQQIDNIRVIVGKKYRQTPIMSGLMTYLEFNPYWNIPRRIARKDILPKVFNDPTYLNRQGIRVFDNWDHQARELDPTSIPWENLSPRDFPYRLRQDPSDLNALGRVKFMFPNHQSVYIHDTPGKALFNRQVRNFSSGCVRVGKPLALAQYLLSNQGWDRTRLEAAIAHGKRQPVSLGSPIPVHLVYFTAWMAEDGQVNFREDIYDLDRQLLLALKKRPSGLVFCSNDAEKGQLLVVYTSGKTGPI